ncbi:hypothetical protein AAHC03_05569 [Spirometra sp. Aus1]
MGCGVGFLKFLLIGLCVLYGVIAICFSGVGIYLIVELQKIPNLANSAKWAPAFFLALGIFLGLVAIFGCAGAVTGNKCLLIIFATVTIVILVAAFIYGIAVLVVSTQVSTVMLDLLFEVFNDDQDAAKVWLGPVETAFKCCGINGSGDYRSIPETCCEPGTSRCSSATAYKEGCGMKIVNTMLKSSEAIGGCCIALAIIQVLAVVGAYMLMSKSASYEQV